MRVDGAPLSGAAASVPLTAPLLIVAALLGVGLGTLVAYPMTALVVLAAAAVAAAGTALLRWPALAPALFWTVFAVQSTIFAEVVVTGLYYPLYAVMAVNVIVGLALARVRVAPDALAAYAVFLGLVVASLLITREPLGFVAYQRLFIYGLGVLVLAQFATRRQLSFLQMAMVAAALAISGWAVYTAFTTGFVHRAGVTTDQNVVSFTLGFGLVVLLARLMTPGGGVLTRALAWLALAFGVYAMLLLASRGITVALAVTAIALYGRILLDVRRSVSLALMAALIGLAVLALPGSDELLRRFDEANLSTANERLPLWNAAIESFMQSNPVQALLGQGFESSKSVILAVRPTTSSTHNAYLQVLVEFGLLGLAAFLAMHLLLLARFWRSRSRTGLYAIGAMLFLLMSNLTLNTPDGFLYWVALGHLMAMAALNREFDSS